MFFLEILILSKLFCITIKTVTLVFAILVTLVQFLQDCHLTVLPHVCMVITCHYKVYKLFILVSCYPLLLCLQSLQLYSLYIWNVLQNCHYENITILRTNYNTCLIRLHILIKQQTNVRTTNTSKFCGKIWNFVKYYGGCGESISKSCTCTWWPSVSDSNIINNNVCFDLLF